ncbi:MAG: hypothetical protein AAF601_14995 [Pseudomonadota bacterium]
MINLCAVLSGKNAAYLDTFFSTHSKRHALLGTRFVEDTASDLIRLRGVAVHEIGSTGSLASLIHNSKSPATDALRQREPVATLARDRLGCALRANLATKQEMMLLHFAGVTQVQVRI